MWYKRIGSSKAGSAHVKSVVSINMILTAQPQYRTVSHETNSNIFVNSGESLTWFNAIYMHKVVHKWNRLQAS